jgi:hypothetical protein
MKVERVLTHPLGVEAVEALRVLSHLLLYVWFRVFLSVFNVSTFQHLRAYASLSSLTHLS